MVSNPEIPDNGLKLNGYIVILNWTKVAEAEEKLKYCGCYTLVTSIDLDIHTRLHCRSPMSDLVVI